LKLIAEYPVKTQWQTLVNTIMNLLVPYEAENLSTNRATISFS
jgi:hypothetical protein